MYRPQYQPVSLPTIDFGEDTIICNVSPFDRFALEAAGRFYQNGSLTQFGTVSYDVRGKATFLEIPIQSIV
jgi:hypothetical protein